jgi:hypothetical protein
LRDAFRDAPEFYDDVSGDGTRVTPQDEIIQPERKVTDKSEEVEWLLSGRFSIENGEDSDLLAAGMKLARHLESHDAAE